MRYTAPVPWSRAGTTVTPATSGDAIGVGVSSASAQVHIKTGSAGTIGLLVDTPASPAANLIEARNNGTTLFQVGAAGDVYSIGGSAAYFLARRDTNAIVWGLYSAAGNLAIYDSVSSVDREVISSTAHTYNAMRVQHARGAAVASANNLTVGTDGNGFHITGTTTINLLNSTGWQNGSEVVLIFDGSLTVKHNQTASGSYKPIFLLGLADLARSAGQTLRLYYDAGIWYQT